MYLPILNMAALEMFCNLSEFQRRLIYSVFFVEVIVVDLNMSFNGGIDENNGENNFGIYVHLALGAAINCIVMLFLICCSKRKALALLILLEGGFTLIIGLS